MNYQIFLKECFKLRNNKMLLSKYMFDSKRDKFINKDFFDFCKKDIFILYPDLTLEYDIMANPKSIDEITLIYFCIVKLFYSFEVISGINSIYNNIYDKFLIPLLKYRYEKKKIEFKKKIVEANLKKKLDEFKTRIVSFVQYTDTKLKQLRITENKVNLIIENENKIRFKENIRLHKQGKNHYYSLISLFNIRKTLNFIKEVFGNESFIKHDFIYDKKEIQALLKYNDLEELKIKFEQLKKKCDIFPFDQNKLMKTCEKERCLNIKIIDSPIFIQNFIQKKIQGKKYFNLLDIYNDYNDYKLDLNYKENFSYDELSISDILKIKCDNDIEFNKGLSTVKSFKVIFKKSIEKVMIKQNVLNDFNRCVNTIKGCCKKKKKFFYDIEISNFTSTGNTDLYVFKEINKTDLLLKSTLNSKYFNDKRVNALNDYIINYKNLRERYKPYEMDIVLKKNGFFYNTEGNWLDRVKIVKNNIKTVEQFISSSKRKRTKEDSNQGKDYFDVIDEMPLNILFNLHTEN